MPRYQTILKICRRIAFNNENNISIVKKMFTQEIEKYKIRNVKQSMARIHNSSTPAHCDIVLALVKDVRRKHSPC